MDWLCKPSDRKSLSSTLRSATLTMLLPLQLSTSNASTQFKSLSKRCKRIVSLRFLEHLKPPSKMWDTTWPNTILLIRCWTMISRIWFSLSNQCKKPLNLLSNCSTSSLRETMKICSRIKSGLKSLSKNLEQFRMRQGSWRYRKTQLAGRSMLFTKTARNSLKVKLSSLRKIGYRCKRWRSKSILWGPRSD